MENDFCTPPCEKVPRTGLQTPATVGMEQLFGITPEKSPMQEDKTPQVLTETNGGGQEINVLKSIKEEGKRSTAPDPLKPPVYQIFRDPARYMSPTDNMISPISLFLLSRNRKPVGLIPPFIKLSSPSKVPEAT